MFLDIDGTLNVPAADTGFTLLTRPSGFPTHVVKDVRDWLCDLQARGVRLIWNSTWNDQCDDYAAWFGLPRDLEWIPHDENRVSFGHSLKVRGAVDFLARHPEIERAVVLDDVLGFLEHELEDVIAGRLFLPELDELHGVTRAVIDETEQFLFSSSSGRTTRPD
ncbi:hypothetical protein AXK58_25110 [Tsukamurella tyrosinosolvens]|nr:hypothetical protein AXK58_25110 [Tsukamurella tyrosinosolvens]